MRNTRTLVLGITLSMFATAGPALAGDALVASWNTHEILRYDEATGAFVGAFVTASSGGLMNPHSVRYGPDGNIYVSSFGTNAVLRYNGQTGAFIDAFVSSGSGGLTNPTDALFGPDGNLYVPSLSPPRVRRYDGQTGAFIDVFIGAGNGIVGGEGATFGPDGRFYLANGNGNNILVYDDQGNFQSVFASGGGLNDVHAVTFGPNGNVFAPAFGNQRVNEYDGTTGAFVQTFIGAGNNLQNAHHVIFRDGSCFVSAFGSDRVNEYDAVTGTFIRAFVTVGSGGLDAAMWMNFMPDPPLLASYGCGVNPAGSLTINSGTPSLGTSFTLGVDNPLGTQAAGSLALLYFSFQPDAAFPCGTSIPGFGMSGPGANGELLINLPQRFFRFSAIPWGGAGNPALFTVPIPLDVSLLEFEFYSQGILLDPTVALGVRLGLTEGMQGRVGF